MYPLYTDFDYTKDDHDLPPRWYDPQTDLCPCGDLPPETAQLCAHVPHQRCPHSCAHCPTSSQQYPFTLTDLALQEITTRLQF